MKLFKNSILLFLLAALVFTSCDEDLVVYDQEIEFSTADPYVEVVTSVVAFVAGTPTYSLDFIVVSGASDATKVKVYKQFTSSATQSTSDIVLLGTYDLDAGSFTRLNFDIDYDQLKEGVMVDGAPLPADENDIPIGSSWVLTIEALNASDAVSFTTAKTITIGVLSPFAGLYEVVASLYVRNNVDEELPWDGEIRFIGSVNDTTYSHPEWFGRFAFADPAEQFIFYLRDDNSILIPASVDGVSQPITFGEYFISCEDLGDDGDLYGLCGIPGANSLIPDGDGPGAHVLQLVYGYYASQGTSIVASRAFYEALVKIVE